MRIGTVSFYNLNPEYNVNNRKTQRLPLMKSQPDVFVPQFTAEEEFRPEKIEGVHCARCGKRTLSYDKYKKILDELGQAKTGIDLYRIVGENKEFMKKGYNFIPDLLMNMSLNVPVREVYQKLPSRLSDLYTENLDHGIDVLRQFGKSSMISDFDKEVTEEGIDRLVSAGPEDLKYPMHKRIVLETYRRLDYKYKDRMFERAFAPFENIYTLRKEMTEHKARTLTEEELNKLFGKLLFGENVAITVPISKKKDLTDDANKVVVCYSCENAARARNHYYSRNDSLHTLKKNYLTYLRDLSIANQLGTINISNDYIFNVVKNIKALDPNLALSSKEIGLMKFQQTHVPLTLERFSDIPCPSCGVKMLTFDEFNDIEEKVVKITGLKGYVTILYANRQHISSNVFHIINEFASFIFANPTLPDNAVKHHMYEYITKVSHKDVKEILKLIKSKMYSPSITSFERAQLKQLREEVLKSCDFDKTHDIVRESVLDDIVKNSPILKNDDKFNLKPSIMKRIEKIKAQQYLIYPSRRMQMEDKKWSEGFTKRAFRLSIFTSDHLFARSLGGRSEQNNLIGLCKCCNTSKRDMEFNDWYQNFVNNDGNLIKYLDKVSEVIDREGLKDFKKYPRDIAEKIYQLSNKKVDLVEKYSKK